MESDGLLFFFAISIFVFLVAAGYLARIYNAGYEVFRLTHYSLASPKEFRWFFFGLWALVIVGGIIAAVSAACYIQYFNL